MSVITSSISPHSPASTPEKKEYDWAYGITTVPTRQSDLFPQTLKSLAAAGFDKPRIFLDGAMGRSNWDTYGENRSTCRYPAVLAVGNWILSMWELYIRNPGADRYALFQDDLVACKGLRTYLDDTLYHGISNVYYNLYTANSNDVNIRDRWKRNKGIDQNLAVCPEQGWYISNQLGRGALALIFDREGLLKLLSSKKVVLRPLDPLRPTRGIDGMVRDAMMELNCLELVHFPSLVQHMGVESTVQPLGYPRPEPSPSFRGVDWDPTTR